MALPWLNIRNHKIVGAKYAIRGPSAEPWNSELSNSQGKKTNWFRLRALSSSLPSVALGIFLLFRMDWKYIRLHFSVKARHSSIVLSRYFDPLFPLYTLLWHHTYLVTFWVLTLLPPIFDPCPQLWKVKILAHDLFCESRLHILF
jgi:hypothetical protein